MLAGEWDERARHGQVERALRDLRRLCGEAVVFANLEVTLDGGAGVIEKQPRVIARPETLVAGLRGLDADVLNLSNNHAFDGLWEGFAAVRRILEAQGTRYLGAGRDRAEASRPLIVSRNGVRLGWLAYTDAATRPSHVADQGSFGVNPLVEEVAVEQVRGLEGEVDHVLVSLHWGVEYSQLPAPGQLDLGRRLIDCGASLVIGHHAHALQGVERHGGGVVAYNLGNALTTDLSIDGRTAIRQTRRSRSSVIFRAVLDKTRVVSVEIIPFRLEGAEVRAGDRYAERVFNRANRRLARGVSPVGWRAARLYEDVFLRTLRKLHPAVLGSLRPRHLAVFFRNVANSLRGRGPA